MTDLFSRTDSNSRPTANGPDQNQVPNIRSDGQHACAICGAPAYFGFGVKLLAGRPGRWSCNAHRDAVKNGSPR